MRGRLALLLGGAAVAGAAVNRFLRRPRSDRVTEPVVADTRVDELREKLAESREVVAERDEFESAETPVDLAEEVAPAPELGDRRRAVHERGRKVAEQMRRPKAE